MLLDYEIIRPEIPNSRQSIKLVIHNGDFGMSTATQKLCVVGVKVNLIK